MSFQTHLIKQPKSFWVLGFGELWSSFSYYGAQTILVLYCLHTFHLTQSNSYLLYGAFAVLAYSLPLAGGIVADKWLGDKNAAIFGSFLSILGNFLLMSPSYYLFCLGAATFLIGCGLYKSSATNLVGALYQNSGSQKETGFTLLYLFVNIGGVLGPLVYGFVAYKAGWSTGFLCSALGILIATIFLLQNTHLLTNTKQATSTKKSIVYMSTLAVCLFLSLPFYILSMMNILVVSIFILGIGYLITTIKKYQNQDRRRLMVLFCISFFTIFYFAASLQIGSTVTLFIQQNIQQGHIHTQLPASTFSMLYPLFVLVLAPFFTYIWNKLEKKSILVNTVVKLFIGMIFAALGIGTFALTSISSFILTGIVVGNLFLSAGELVIMPAVYTTISNLAPEGMKSTMMGCFFLCISAGGYLSGVLANVSHFFIHTSIPNQSEYLGQFLFIAGFTCTIAIILLISMPKLSKMMH